MDVPHPLQSLATAQRQTPRSSRRPIGFGQLAEPRTTGLRRMGPTPPTTRQPGAHRVSQAKPSHVTGRRAWARRRTPVSLGPFAPRFRCPSGSGATLQSTAYSLALSRLYGSLLLRRSKIPAFSASLNTFAADVLGSSVPAPSRTYGLPAESLRRSGAGSPGSTKSEERRNAVPRRTRRRSSRRTTRRSQRSASSRRSAEGPLACLIDLHLVSFSALALGF